MRLRRHLLGKYHAALTLARFIRHLENWGDVWACYRRQEPLPPFRLRPGVVIAHRPEDCGLWKLQDIVLAGCYTKGGFYRPAPRDVVLDLGANIGTFALYLQARAPGIRVHCFEPSASTREVLHRNVEANHLGESVRIYPYGVSDHRRMATLFAGEQSGQSSLFGTAPPSGQASTEEVECLGLDEALDLCEVDRVALLKIDTEGSEIDIVEGASAATWQRIERVVLEFHENLRPGCRDRIEAILRGYGFGQMEVEQASRGGRQGILRAARG